MMPLFNFMQVFLSQGIKIALSVSSPRFLALSLCDPEMAQTCVQSRAGQTEQKRAGRWGALGKWESTGVFSSLLVI